MLKIRLGGKNDIDLAIQKGETLDGRTLVSVSSQIAGRESCKGKSARPRSESERGSALGGAAPLQPTGWASV